ncbi:Pyridoxal phosphate-dependent transferase domain 1-containing protein [Dioscorea alata]|uniref:Pyridoxal phosphate-dependent transferase domain 1-containing protein n=1 Tax=Dioscorea alata TaxID=55571 RepID=A0ACB7TRT2_DIOAL|nr:Pyridoxal phosphate-dependent transferase domain 1-containing protein [Dioscorea alata]
MEELGMEPSSPSIFEIMLSWFTPTVLFLILNLVIGTIVLTSKAMHRNHTAAAVAAGSDDRPKISRTSSAFVLERLRSLGLYRLRSGEIPLETSDPPPPPPSEAAEIEETVQEDEAMRKSSGEKTAVVRRAASVRREEKEEEEEKEVDARADDFINRFRHQLRLQRLESLTQYKDMLNRGN